ncbi:MAG: hypothetical protein U5Q03_18340 [Bacteroidota bacterium]|nr:hypothetical protein [Bacteroidota bacterium]
MISGEYLVLHGALSLAVPTKFGQKLLIDKYETDEPLLRWRSFVKDDFWFEAEFSLPDFDVLKTNKIRYRQPSFGNIDRHGRYQPGFHRL